MKCRLTVTEFPATALRMSSIQAEKDRAIRMFVSGNITEAQLDHQRRIIAERHDSARAKLDDYLVRWPARLRIAAKEDNPSLGEDRRKRH